MNKELENALKDTNELYDIVLQQYKNNLSKTDLLPILTELINRRTILVSLGLLGKEY